MGSLSDHEETSYTEEGLPLTSTGSLGTKGIEPNLLDNVFDHLDPVDDPTSLHPAGPADRHQAIRPTTLKTLWLGSIPHASKTR